MFLFYSPVYRRALHSFPTRRSSDLGRHAGAVAAGAWGFVGATAGRGARHRLRGAGLAVRGDRAGGGGQWGAADDEDRKSTRLNSSHVKISYAVFCLKKNTL